MGIIDSEKNVFYDVESIQHALEMNDVTRTSLLITITAENRKQAGLDTLPDETWERIAVMCSINQLIAMFIEQEMIDEYILIYEATKYIPHGSILQPMYDLVFKYYHDRKASGKPLNKLEESILERYIELSLEVYDKLGSFKVFLDEFREHIPLRCFPKATSIGNKLGDEDILYTTTSMLMAHPRV